LVIKLVSLASFFTNDSRKKKGMKERKKEERRKKILAHTPRLSINRTLRPLLQFPSSFSSATYIIVCALN
jgi:ribosomal protein L18